jgi:predicted dehydrogenase
MVPTQRTIIYGTQKKMEIEIPFFHPNDRPSRISLDEGGFVPEKSYVELAVCDQYTIQGDAFSLAVINNSEVPVPLEDTLKNTAVLKAIFRSVETGKWEKPEY